MCGNVKRCYLSGPMSGIADFNRPEFEAAAARLRAAGVDVVSPIELDAADSGEITPDADWRVDDDTYFRLIRRDVVQIAECDQMVLLPGWQKSRGCRIEVAVCRLLHIPVVELLGSHPGWNVD